MTVRLRKFAALSPGALFKFLRASFKVVAELLAMLSLIGAPYLGKCPIPLGQFAQFVRIVHKRSLLVGGRVSPIVVNML